MRLKRAVDDARASSRDGLARNRGPDLCLCGRHPHQTKSQKISTHHCNKLLPHTLDIQPALLRLWRYIPICCGSFCGRDGRHDKKIRTRTTRPKFKHRRWGSNPQPLDVSCRARRSPTRYHCATPTRQFGVQTDFWETLK